MKPVSLHLGPPEEQGTFTRFALPFAYRPELVRRPWPFEALFRPTPAAAIGLARERYFTRNTSQALYARSLWLTLDWRPEDSVLLVDVDPLRKRSDKGRVLRMHVHPPQVVLVEALEGDRVQPSLEGENLTRSGFLLVDVSFDAEQEHDVVYEDLLAFNELYRYWREPFPGHNLEKGYGNFIDPGARQLPLYFDRWAQYLDHPFEDHTGERWRLVPLEGAGSTRATREWAQAAPLEGLRRELGWIPYEDDRCFVWTCAVTSDGLDSLRCALPVAKSAAPMDAHGFGHWLRLVNVDEPDADASKTHMLNPFESDWLGKRTYTRWGHYHCYYGFSPHSGAVITGWDEKRPIQVPQHFREIYFDMALILLYLRVSAFRFSHRLTELSLDASRSKDRQLILSEQFEALRWSFTLLTNLYRYPLISNNQQGIELFERMRGSLDVEELFKEVERKLAVTDDYLRSAHGHELALAANRLSVVAATGLVLALGITAVDVYDAFLERHDGVGAGAFVWATVKMALLIGIVLLFASLRSRKLLGGWNNLERDLNRTLSR